MILRQCWIAPQNKLESSQKRASESTSDHRWLLVEQRSRRLFVDQVMVALQWSLLAATTSVCSKRNLKRSPSKQPLCDDFLSQPSKVFYQTLKIVDGWCNCECVFQVWCVCTQPSPFQCVCVLQVYTAITKGLFQGAFGWFSLYIILFAAIRASKILFAFPTKASDSKNQTKNLHSASSFARRGKYRKNITRT